MKIRIDGWQQLQLLSAGHVLSLPSGVLGVRHKQARAIVRSILGSCPKGHPTGPDLASCYEWLGLTPATPEPQEPTP